MRDMKQSNTTVNGDYVYRIYGGHEGLSLTRFIRKAHREFANAACFTAGTQAIIAHGVEIGLNIIRDHSMPKYGLSGRGVVASDLSVMITAKLTKTYPGHPTDVIHEVMTAIATKVKCLSDAQNTESRLRKRALIGAA